MIYPRKLKPKLVEQLDNDLTLVITGMRRVGKTYLMQDIYQQIESENKLFLDLEKPENRRVWQAEQYQAVIKNLEFLGLKIAKREIGSGIDLESRAWIFVDEIQYWKQMPSIIKYLQDHYQVKFIVSGSSSFYLKNLFTESLSGRKMIFRLNPLDFGEFLRFRGVDKVNYGDSLQDLWRLNTEMIAGEYEPWFREFLEIGGFPQVVLAVDGNQRQQLWHDILDSYLNIDVRTLSDLRGVRELEQLVNLLPARVGSKLDVSKLSREIGVSRVTLTNYLRFLEDTFVINLVSPYSKSPDREITRASKLYFCDWGLGGALSPVGEGQRFENVVFNSLASRFEINYYQRKSGAEIDFVLDKSIGVEVKIFGDQRDYQRLTKIAVDIGLTDYLVVTEKAQGLKDEQVMMGLLLGLLE